MGVIFEIPRKIGFSKLSSGFTIVELLIVIIVIAILATLVITAYNGVQDKAKLARAQSDITELKQAIMAARVNTGKTLREITGSSWSMGSCVAEDGVSLELPPTAGCWNRYRTDISNIETAADASLSSLKDGSPYGLPYLIDENEGEVSGDECSEDYLSAVLYQTEVERVVEIPVPLSLPQCN